MAAIQEGDGFQVVLPDCTCRGLHLSGPNRFDVAAAILTHQSFLNASLLPAYSCELEDKAGQYFTQREEEEPMCPSHQRGLTCLTYRGPQANQPFSKVVSEAMMAWEAGLNPMSNVVQLGCNYARRPDENEITCYFRSVVPYNE